MTERYTFSSLHDFLYVELGKAILRGNAPRQCRLCGRWFLHEQGDRAMYCERIAPGEESKTCREARARAVFEKKIQDEDTWKIYKRAYKKYYARYMKGNMSEAEFKAWAAQAAAWGPEVLIITSPYQVMYADYFHISPGRGATGDMFGFGAAQTKLVVEYDAPLRDEIIRCGEAAGDCCCPTWRAWTRWSSKSTLPGRRAASVPGRSTPWSPFEVSVKNTQRGLCNLSDHMSAPNQTGSCIYTKKFFIKNKFIPIVPVSGQQNDRRKK